MAELGNNLSKKEYSHKVPILRTNLLEAQLALGKADFPVIVIVIVSGEDGAGKGHTGNLLNECFDPRYVGTFAVGEPSDEELERPEKEA